MQLNDNEISFLLSIKSRPHYFNKINDRNSPQRIVAEGLKIKGLVQIEDVSIDKDLEFSQLTVRGKQKIDDIEQK